MARKWTEAEIGAVVVAAQSAAESAAGWATRRKLYAYLRENAPDNLCTTAQQAAWLQALQTVGALAMPLTSAAS